MFFKVFSCVFNRRKSYQFWTTWVWINVDGIFAWTVPLMDNTKTITAERDISRIPCNFHFCTTHHFFTCSQIFFILPLLIIWTSEFLHPPQAAEEINLEAQIKANWTSRERERKNERFQSTYKSCKSPWQNTRTPYLSWNKVSVLLFWRQYKLKLPKQKSRWYEGQISDKDQWPWK